MLTSQCNNILGIEDNPLSYLFIVRKVFACCHKPFIIPLIVVLRPFGCIATQNCKSFYLFLEQMCFQSAQNCIRSVQDVTPREFRYYIYFMTRENFIHTYKASPERLAHLIAVFLRNAISDKEANEL